MRNVSLPYWNWSDSPSGQNFPASVEKEFLDPGEYYPEDCPRGQPCRNPLWVAGRRAGTSCPGVVPGCIQETLALKTWSDFAGDERRRAGDFEHQAHDFMHARYIQGPMGNSGTAAQDPIYWLFHSYIDLVWDSWQKLHLADPCAAGAVPHPERKLAIGDWPPASIRFEHVLCADALGYRYEIPPSITIAQLPSCPSPNRRCGTGAMPAATATIELELPSADVREVKLALSGLTVPGDFSYYALVLLHPKAAPYRPDDARFVDEHLASEFVVWRHGGHHAKDGGGHSTDLHVDLTKKASELGLAGAGRELTATLVFNVANPAERSRPIVFGKDVSIDEAALLVEGAGTREFPLGVE